MICLIGFKFSHGTQKAPAKNECLSINRTKLVTKTKSPTKTSGVVHHW